MNVAQILFDRCAMPNCPSQLTSPKLHSILNNTSMKSICLAMKGVGSQGDGSVQILCADEVAQERVLVLLTELGCEGFKLTIPASALTLADDRLVLSPYRIKSAVLVFDPSSSITVTGGVHSDSRVSVPAPESVNCHTTPSSLSISHILTLCEELISNDIESISIIVGHQHQPEGSDSTSINHITTTTSTTKEVENLLAHFISPSSSAHDHNGQNYDLIHQKRVAQVLSKVKLIRQSDIKPTSTAPNGHNSGPSSADDEYILVLRAETLFTHTNSSNSDNRPDSDHGIHSILTSIRHHRSAASVTTDIGVEQTGLSTSIYVYTTVNTTYDNALELPRATHATSAVEDGVVLYFGGVMALPCSILSLYDLTNGPPTATTDSDASLSNGDGNEHDSISIPLRHTSNSSATSTGMHPLDAYLSRLRLIQHPSPEASPVYTGTGRSTKQSNKIVYI